MRAVLRVLLQRLIFLYRRTNVDSGPKLRQPPAQPDDGLEMEPFYKFKTGAIVASGLDGHWLVRWMR